jgi:hypothetical protein
MQKPMHKELGSVVATMVALAAGAADAQVAPNAVLFTTVEPYRYVQSNGIPDHRTGAFPNAGNPNVIRPQKHNWRMPLHPVEALTPTPLRRQPFGVALNGIPFDPGTAEFWNSDPGSGWHYEALKGSLNLGVDLHNAHVQPTGAYHYHGLPVALMLRRDKGDQMILVGFAADGFPIYGLYGYRNPDDATSGLRMLHSSYRLKKGVRPSRPGGPYDGTFVEDYEYVEGSGDLDECNGCYGVTPEYPDGTYYYVITDTFPFIPRAFRGTPDRSFERRPLAGIPPGPRHRPPHFTRR